MIRRARLALCLASLAAACHSARPARTPAASATLAADLDRLIAAPALSRAILAVRIDSLDTGDTLFSRHADKLVVPASNMKLLTLAAAASRLGWDYRFITTVEAAGSIADGVLTGDLVVTGTGDPSIVSADLDHPALFLEWAAALLETGIRRIDGRLVGDDDAFDDRGPGPGWAWDYLDAGYAAPAGALSYQENVVALRIAPGARDGAPATVDAGPPGHPLRIVNDVLTGPPESATAVTVVRPPGSSRVVVGGRIPAGAAPIARTVTVPNPTQFFVAALREALASRGITVARGAWDVDDLDTPVAAGSRVPIARRESAPLSALAGRFLKDSQNFYGEMLLKAVGRAADQPGTTAAGREAARDALAALGIAPDSYVMHDGSGLSRYDYVTADAVVTLLRAVWRDEAMRASFVAALPVAGQDGTLSGRLRDSPLAGRVQAKTGSIANMRALSGYLTTETGERFAFSMIANHFTAPASDVDAVMEAVLRRIAGTALPSALLRQGAVVLLDERPERRGHVLGTAEEQLIVRRVHALANLELERLEALHRR